MPDDLRDRITAQFSYRSERADVWRAFDRFLETDAFLNLGYSTRYQSHLVGSSQRRLARKLGRALDRGLPVTDGVRLLDVGCGRGGPAVEVADRFGFDVTGVDLVPYNVARARENARERAASADFLVGDATRLPVASDAMGACASVDALVYLPDRAAVFAELARVLDSDGVVVLSDLVARPDLDDDARRGVARFARSWDMPSLGSVPAYENALADAGFDVRAVEDLTPHSVGGFRKWTTAFTRLHDSPLGPLVDRLLARWGFDTGTVVEQIRHAHAALPHLRHVLLVAEPST